MRLCDDCASDGDAPPHTARELRRQHIIGVFQLHEPQHFAHPAFNLVGRDFFLNQAEGDIFINFHRVKKRALLKDNSNASSKLEQLLLRHSGDFLTEHADPPAIGRKKAHGKLKECALARACDTEYRLGFSVGQLERNVGQHHFFIECDGDVIKLDGAARRVSGGWDAFFAR